MPTFTNKWFEDNTQPIWEQRLGIIPAIATYLEIGTCEGQSLLWVLDNLKPKRATAIDWYRARKKSDQKIHDTYRKNFVDNLSSYLTSGRVKLLEGDSRIMLPMLAQQEAARSGSYDLIYVDGTHTGPGCMLDMLNSYHLLTPPVEGRKMKIDGHLRDVGGMMVVDDTNRTWNRYPEVKIAVHQFELLMHGHMSKIWTEEKQIAFVRIR